MKTSYLARSCAPNRGNSLPFA